MVAYTQRRKLPLTLAIELQPLFNTTHVAPLLAWTFDAIDEAKTAAAARAAKGASSSAGGGAAAGSERAAQGGKRPRSQSPKERAAGGGERGV